MDVSRRGMWGLIACFGAAVAAALAWAGLGVTGSLTPGRLALAVAALAVANSRHVRRTPVVERLAGVIEGWTAFGLVCLLGAAGSYALAATSTGYVDAMLADADERLGLDWLALYRLTASDPWLQRIGRAAYGGIFWLPMIVIAALAWTGEAAAMRRFVAGYAVSLGATLAMFPWFPARSALVHHLGDAAPYAPYTGVGHVLAFERLRTGTVSHVDLDDLSGMITFPSFHAASALLFVWGAWPIPHLRFPVILVAGAMWLATPIEGTHYFVDVIAGTSLAAVVMLAMERRQPRARPIEALAAA